MRWIKITNRKRFFVQMAILSFMLIIMSFQLADVSNLSRQLVDVVARSQTVKIARMRSDSLKAEADKKNAAAKLAFTPDVQLPVSDGITAPLIYRVNTEQKVVFLTIDDGTYRDQSVVNAMRDNKVKASLFLTKALVWSEPEFFNQLVDTGSLIENHTISHDLNMVHNQDYNQMVLEICSMADYEQLHYGRRPVFYRPPGGAYDDTMLRAAAACDMKGVITWTAKASDGAMQYQVGDSLRPGDIVLMHFRPEFDQDLKAFLDAMNAAGLRMELLEDYLPK
jgi:peptidoglycan/xylan/chitin deacetylase (PgdA/CDA1 family)